MLYVDNLAVTDFFKNNFNFKNNVRISCNIFTWIDTVCDIVSVLGIIAVVYCCCGALNVRYPEFVVLNLV